MIFKTIENKDNDGNVIDAQVVSFIKARKIAQDELNKSIAEQTAQLVTDEKALRKLEDAIKSNVSYEEAFDDAMKGASASAKEHALTTKGAAGSTDVFVAKQEQAQESLKATTTASKGASIAMKALATVGNMFIGWAISEVLTLASKAISDYINRLEISKEKLAETESELESVNSEYNDTISKIRELESLEMPSLTDKEDLERLRAENKELAIRKKYLEDQKKLESEEVVQNAKEKMDYNYGRTTSRESIDAYKAYMDNPTLYNNETDTTTIKIAQYEHYQELRKQALENKDLETIEILDTKLKDIEESLLADRTELQSFKDDLSLTGESSAELDNVTNKLKFIDELLLAPSENLRNFLNSDEIAKDTARLTELANSGELTESQFKNSFANINSYLEENNLTFQDLISVLEIYRDELEGLQNVNKTADLLGISETVTALNTKLKPALDSLAEAYHEIFTEDGFTLENVNLDMFTSIQDELSKAEINIDNSSFENLYNVLNNTESTATEVQEAFDRLAFSISNVSVSGVEDFNVLKNTLQQLGYIDYEMVALQSLAQNTDALAEAGLNLANATEEQMEAFVSETLGIQNVTEAVKILIAEKQLNALEDMNTSTEVANLINLARNAGVTAEVIERLTELEKIYQEIASGKFMGARLEIAKNRAAELKKEIEDISSKATEEKQEWKPKTPPSTSGSSKQTEKEVDIMKELNSEMDEYQSKLEAVQKARETYNEYGKITVDQAQDIIDADFRLLEAYGSEEEALERLGRAKLNEMQIQLARNALDTINSITSEAMAADYLAGANENLAKSYESVTEAMLNNAVAHAKERGILQGQAAETILKGYQNGVTMLGQVDFGFNLEEAENAKKEQEKASKETKKEFKKVFDWIEKFLDNLSRKTDKLMDKIDKFLSWQKKNSMINRVIKSTDNEITQSQKAYQAYMKKANSVGLSKKYRDMIQNGKLSVETLTDEGVSDKIDQYMEWYDKAQSVKDSIEELYDQERDLIRQKLDNIIDYYSDMDSYLSSVTSKIESLIDLNEQMGKRSSLTELVKQFADVSAQLSNVTQKSSEIKTSVTEIDFGESESVKEAIAKNRNERIDSINEELANLYLSSETSGVYKKLENDIKKKEDEIQKYLDNDWEQTKEKKYNKLWAELDDLYDLQAELDAYATTSNISNYKKVYTKFQKLENKIDSGKDLTKSEQKKYDSYWEQLEEMRISAKDEIGRLNEELGLWEGTIAPESDVEKAQNAKDSVQKDLEDTATYKKLDQNIEKTKDKMADVLDGREYDELSNKQKKTYDKLAKTLEQYYDRKKALDENATADNVAEYNKIYIAWKKLQDKLDDGKNLSTSQWKQYNKYTEQLKAFEEAKDALVSDLEEKLDEARNPKDKLEIIEAEYEKSAEGIFDSYDRQIKGVENAIKETAQYQNLLAKIGNLKTKSEISGLSADDETRLNKYKAKLEALEEGASVENLSEYISTWDKFYKLQQKLDKNDTLSDGDAANYDKYKAQLEKWNKEKQQQIDDLTSLMEDELEALKKTYVENVSEAESQISEYYANLYELAKQIAEFNVSNLEEQLALLDSYISYYQQIVDLYNRFSDDKLSKLLSDLDIDVVEGQDALYAEYLAKLQSKYDTTLSKINEYKELLGALDEDDFEGNMQLFQKTMENYRANGEEDKANQLQKVLDLLNERAVDANNWGEYADQWANEWEKALADAKTELIGIAGSIQDVNDQLREIKFSNITGAITELSNAQDMLSSIVGLINDDWMFNADGDLTQYGLTKVGLLVEQMEQAKQEANKYAELISSIESMRNTYSSDDAYKQAMQEAKMNYLTSLGDLQNYQDSIVSILTKADESIVNSLKDVIDKRKEALRKKKELYDYDKSIKSSQKEIDSIKAQIHALESLSDITDAATKAKLAQLNADLLEKEEALKETKDEHTYNLQIDALDEFLESLNNTMNNTTDSVNKSFETYIEAINSALKIYGENKEWLNDWSNNVLDTVTGMGSVVGGSGVDLDVSSDNTSAAVSGTPNPFLEKLKVEEPESYDRIQKMIDYFTNNSILVRAEESPLLTANPEMMSFMQNYVPQMAVSVNHTIPEMIKNRNEQTVVNVHYDSMLTVNGNVDSNVARLLPKQLEQAADYTISKIYREQRILR